MACALWGNRVCEASDFESAARLARARSIRYWGLSYRDRDLGPEQWRTPGEGPMVPRLAEARHRALTGFEPTVLCAASVPAPVAEPVDAPDSKSGVRKDVPVRVGPGAPAMGACGGCAEAQNSTWKLSQRDSEIQLASQEERLRLGVVLVGPASRPATRAGQTGGRRGFCRRRSLWARLPHSGATKTGRPKN